MYLTYKTKTQKTKVLNYRIECNICWLLTFRFYLSRSITACITKAETSFLQMNIVSIKINDINKQKYIITKPKCLSLLH